MNEYLILIFNFTIIIVSLIAIIITGNWWFIIYPILFGLVLKNDEN